MMDSSSRETWQYRDQWIKEQLKERGWSETEVKRGEQYRNSEKYIIVGSVWSLFILPAPIGLLLIIYGVYLRLRYKNRGEIYLNRRKELKWEFTRRGLNEPPEEWSAEERRWKDWAPVPDWW